MLDGGADAQAKKRILQCFSDGGRGTSAVKAHRQEACVNAATAGERVYKNLIALNVDEC